MGHWRPSRRSFLQTAGGVAASALLRSAAAGLQNQQPADHALHIQNALIEIGKNRFVSTTAYNGEFPGPLLRFREGERVSLDLRNDTDTPEQVHWHGQTIGADVDGAAEEGTPFVPARGSRRISFVPQPAGLRFVHTHIRAGSDLNRGQYTAQVAPVYIEPKDNPGRYDREVFLTLKEFEPWLSHGGDMANDFLAGKELPDLKEKGEGASNASTQSGRPHGFEVNYRSFTINGKMLGHGEPIRVKRAERVLFHVLNGSATEIRSLALPGHTFTVVAMDGNPLPRPVRVPVLWLGTAERISAVVEMNQPGVWVLGDTADDDRRHGMGIVVEYAGATDKPQWVAPKPFHWNYAHFGLAGAPSQAPDETIDMLFEKHNAAVDGFNQWTINGAAYPDMQSMEPATVKLKEGRRYRIRMKNASDDIHPVHMHRHTFEVTRAAGQALSGLRKDVVMVGGYQSVEIDFVANNPGMTLFHCHQQLHMDFGFMTLFAYE